MTNTKKTLLLSVRATVIAALVAAFLIFMNFGVRQAGSGMSELDYLRESLPAYWQSLVAFSATVGIFVILKEMSWTNITTFSDDFIDDWVVILLFVVMLCAPILLGMSETMFWGIKGVTSTDLFFVCVGVG